MHFQQAVHLPASTRTYFVLLLRDLLADALMMGSSIEN
jgi:hypothetical protein